VDHQLTAVAAPTPDGWWREKTRWFVDRPKTVIAVLALLGIVVRQGWISTQPLSAGDWSWRAGGRIASFFPWPSFWDPSLGLGGANRFVNGFRFPVEALSGVLSQLGASWTFIERVLYFVPFAILLPVAGWLLAREIMGRTRWTLLTPLLLLGNTYFLVEANGEIPLALAEALGILVLFGFVRTMRQRSVGWACLTGILLGATCAFDIRPAYLCVVLMAMYFVVLALTSLDWHLLWRRTLLGTLTLGTFVALQAFWVVPLLTYHGNGAFPIPPTPDFPIITLAHGLTGVIAAWTGGVPAMNVPAPLNPAFMILPILALAPLLARRVTPQVIWLALAALCFAFLANTDNPPFGVIYDWMYAHIPGWNLFREGSKFLFVVGVAYAILIPITFKKAFDWVSSRSKGLRKSLARGGAVAALLGVVALSCSSIAVLESGSLASTTIPTSEPASFVALSKMLAQDARPGALLWFGQPMTTNGLQQHTFIIGTPIHPDEALTGQFSAANDVNDRDPFQLYCADTIVPFCYVDQLLFPYLARISGAGYVVVPGGNDVGMLPPGITRTWLRQQMTLMFGQPTLLGSSTTQLLVWRLPSPDAAVTGAAALAAVNGGTWTTPLVLPALEAMDIPATYSQSFDNTDYPASAATLPDSIAVLPRTDGGCVSAEPDSVAVMARSTQSSLNASIAGTSLTLPLLTVAARLPDWSLYGPVAIGPGEVPMSPLTPGTALGPCIAWSPLTKAVLAPLPSVISNVAVESGGQQVTASSSGTAVRWVELHRFYDHGWQLGGEPPVATGDGLFSLYHVDAVGSVTSQLTFSFSTTMWEPVGLLISGVVLIIALIIVVRDLRRRRGSGADHDISAPEVFLRPSVVGRWIASLGIAMLAVTALAVTVEWFGLPSVAPWTAFASDPYGLDVGYGAAAIGILILSVAIRVGAHLLRVRVTDRQVHAVRARAGLGAIATMVVISALLLSSCAGSPGDVQSLLTHGQQAGAASPIEGSSLEEAQLQSAANQPQLCIADYTRVLASSPDLVQAYVGRAGCYMSGGRNSAAAIHDYSKAISLSPATSSLFLLRANADRASGNLTAALSDYEQAGMVPSATPTQQLSAVTGLLAMDDYEAARTVYQEASQRDPGSSTVYVAAASIAIATGDEATAGRDYAAALKLATNTFEITQVLSRVCHQELLDHEYAQAIVDCTNDVQLSPAASGAYDDLSAAELAMGYPATALIDMNAAIGAWIGTVGPYAQPAGVDGYGLAQLYSARGWIEVQLHLISAAVADFKHAVVVLPAPAPDIRAQLEASISTAEAGS